jgi:hypothetical protein
MPLPVKPVFETDPVPKIREIHHHILAARSALKELAQTINDFEKQKSLTAADLRMKAAIQLVRSIYYRRNSL